MFAFLSSTDPAVNLSIEELLLQKIQHLEPMLLLYVNQPCVVMGKHQNPSLECNPQQLTARGLSLLRRQTGGGTVYHDLGNLNFSFIMPKQTYNEFLHFSIIQSSLRRFGVFSELDTHKSIWTNQRKFSGSAFARKLVGNIHHGTLLVNANLQHLEAALVPENPNLQTKAPRSRRANVCNLSDSNSDITIDSLAHELIIEFCALFPQSRVHENFKPDSYFTQEELAPIIARHKSQEWVIGATPKY